MKKGVSGSPVIRGNVLGGSLDEDSGLYTGGKANNAELYKDKTISVTGELEAGAYLGVSGSLGAVAGGKGYTLTETDAAAFRADDESCLCVMDGNVIRLKKLVESLDVSFEEAGSYNGEAQTPGFTVKDGDSTVEEDAYTKSWRNNVNAGTATFVLIGTGDYFGTAVKTFKIGTAALTVTAEDKTKEYDNDPGTDPALSAVVTGLAGNDTLVHR